MPVLRQELRQIPSGVRKLRVEDGSVDIAYHFHHYKPEARHSDLHPVNVTCAHHGKVVRVMDFASPAKAKNLLGKVAEGVESFGTNVLAFTTAKMFNEPRWQNLVQSVGRGTRVGLVVDEELEKMTLAKLEASLRKWLPVWKADADAENHGHPPYLALRQRLSDEKSGRLDGGKIARFFGLSMAEMGAVCGVSKQSIHSHPTSKGIQEKLEPLAKAARGVLWCGGDESKFKAWLNQPNPDFPEYEGRQLSPLDLIRMGHARIIADKVQNLLTGHPS